MKYETGFDFWRDLASSFGLEDAQKIACEYLAMQESSDAEERNFCSELTDAMNLALARKGA